MPPSKNKPILILLLFITLLVLPGIAQASNTTISPENYTRTFDNTSNVRINQSTMMYNYPATDWTIWLLSGILGLTLFLISLRLPSTKSGVEINIIISVFSWIPIAFCGYASFAVDRLSSYGVTSQVAEYVLLENHIVYSFPVIGIGMFVFLIIAIINTIRLIAIHRIFSGEGYNNND
jgi:hypothetical protein